MESFAPRLAWMKLDSTGMWSPLERPGWWINFSASTNKRTEMYGPFIGEKEAEKYLRWALYEVTLNAYNEPQIAFALRNAENVRILEVQNVEADNISVAR